MVLTSNNYSTGKEQIIEPPHGFVTGDWYTLILFQKEQDNDLEKETYGGYRYHFYSKPQIPYIHLKHFVNIKINKKR